MMLRGPGPERDLYVQERFDDAGAHFRDARTGAPTRLFDALRGPHWTLALFAGRAEDVPSDGRLQAAEVQGNFNVGMLGTTGIA